MTLIYRCNQCNQETTNPVTVSVRTGQNVMPTDMHACGPDDAIRLVAPLIRDSHTRTIMILPNYPTEPEDAYS